MVFGPHGYATLISGSALGITMLTNGLMKRPYFYSKQHTHHTLLRVQADLMNSVLWLLLAPQGLGGTLLQWELATTLGIRQAL